MNGFRIAGRDGHLCVLATWRLIGFRQRGPLHKGRIMRHNRGLCRSPDPFPGEVVKLVHIGIIGTGWCGGIRAETCATHPVVASLHIAENRPERLAEVARATGAKTATTDYKE